jgi:hypothetical protein
VTPEEFEDLKRDWTALATSRPIDTLKLRCFYCWKDLTGEAAFFSARLQAAVCSKHIR